MGHITKRDDAFNHDPAVSCHVFCDRDNSVSFLQMVFLQNILTRYFLSRGITFLNGKQLYFRLILCGNVTNRLMQIRSRMWDTFSAHRVFQKYSGKSLNPFAKHNTNFFESPLSMHHGKHVAGWLLNTCQLSISELAVGSVSYLVVDDNK